MSARPSVALAAAHVAALRAGLVVVPMNTGYQPREIAHLVRDARPRAALADDRSRLLTIAEHVVEPLRLAGLIAEGEITAVAALASPGDGTTLLLDAAEPDDDALIVYTSGTTGTPKGAVLSHGNCLASVEAVRSAWHWERDDLLVLPLPLFHVHGLAVGLHGSLAAGSAVVLGAPTTPAELAAALGHHHASLLFAVPTIYSRLAGHGQAAALGRLRLAVSGSAPLPAELHGALAAASGQAVLERYGMSETLMLTSNPYEGERRPGTVGVPLPGVELRLADGGRGVTGDAGSGTGADTGEDGEILVRGPNVFGGYLGPPELSAGCFEEGGWFCTGDVGRLDPDGYLRIVGRASELVVTGGYNVYPREVEDVLRTAHGVADAAVAGEPHPDWGEAVVAYVEALPGERLNEAALQAHIAPQLAAYKRPKRIVVVEALPRNSLGKVVKSELG
jgi:acyl-CoA synthetase (AMP-forming)/AMP-acid ligase II